ncbi:hypothetical protein PRIPAC_72158 [Pristionchus pacificus]|uniref:CUB domain-containing protein n=1 Tax=Pristionchus pacificus TaxID=54126 RepID=A0A2A6BRH5_PRIPA|nr:hypothetical protein PRIPAC_72158 [Pristionchus pacificus]|eukprot:PDM68468.1 CUB domain-containing protein [Pristionchus pacificus]
MSWVLYIFLQLSLFNAAEATKGCGGIINKHTGVISSPQYPNASDEVVECVWTIVAPEGPGYGITFIIEEMDGEKEYEKNIEKYTEGKKKCGIRAPNRLEFYHGNSVSRENLHKVVCSKPVWPVEPKNGSMTIRYVQQSPTYRGFKATFDLDCHNIMFAPSGTIKAPEFHDGDPTTRKCSWRISFFDGARVKATFPQELVEISETRNTNVSACYGYTVDFLHRANGQARVRNANGDVAAAPSDKPICSSHTELIDAQSVNGPLLIMHVVMHASDRRKFEITWEYEVILKRNGQQLSTPGQIVGRSGNYPMHKVGCTLNSTYCRWWITAPLGQRIVANITMFMSNASKCEKQYEDGNYIVVHGHHARRGDADFHGLDSRILIRYSAINEPLIVKSPGHEMLIETKIANEELANIEKFFKADISFTTDLSCGGVVHVSKADRQVLLPHSYPLSYPAHSSCEWTIKTPPGMHPSFDIHTEDYSIPPGNCSGTIDYEQFVFKALTRPTYKFCDARGWERPMCGSRDFYYEFCDDFGFSSNMFETFADTVQLAFRVGPRIDQVVGMKFFHMRVKPMCGGEEQLIELYDIDDSRYAYCYIFVRLPTDAVNISQISMTVTQMRTNPGFAARNITVFSTNVDDSEYLAYPLNDHTQNNFKAKKNIQLKISTDYTKHLTLTVNSEAMPSML